MVPMVTHLIYLDISTSLHFRLTFYCTLLFTGVVPFAGATFMAYEFLDKAWGKPKWKMTPVENFINGCAAAVFSQVNMGK